MEFIEFGDIVVALSLKNGSIVNLTREQYEDKEYIRSVIHEYDTEEIAPIEYNKNLMRNVVISLHISGKCNLACKYCFKTHRNEKSFTVETAIHFIEMIITDFAGADNYTVDFTGSGEPFLEIEKIVEIAEYCRLKMNDIRKEIILYLATNGTLIDKETVKKLRELNVIIGISLDSPNKDNDAYRIYPNGDGTHKHILSNIKKIKGKKEFGFSSTLTDKNLKLVNTMKQFLKLSDTINIKPVRGVGGVTEDNIEKFKSAYTEYYEYILFSLMKSNDAPFRAVVSGDDFFGKFLIRVISNQIVSTRCDGGISKFSLSNDGKIYTCPAAIDIEELIVGNLEDGINFDMVNMIWEIQTKRTKCYDCFAKFICGGECMVNSFYKTSKLNEIDEVMCELKKHLTKLALLFRSILLTHYPGIFEHVYWLIVEKINRMRIDEEFSTVVEKYKDKYSYIELKEMSYREGEKYKKLL